MLTACQMMNVYGRFMYVILTTQSMHCIAGGEQDLGRQVHDRKEQMVLPEVAILKSI